jgi:hypothetical protein
MSQPQDKKIFEERNDFPEKVTPGVDSVTDTVVSPDDDAIDLSVELEEISFLEEEPARASDPIVDENPGSKKNAKESYIIDVELLASEIDSLGQVTGKVIHPVNDDDFDAILGSDDLSVIDDLVKSNNVVELDALEPVSQLSTGEDRAFLIQEKDALSERVLWKEDDDFRITEVVGIDGVTPDTLVDYIHSRIQEVEPISEESKQAVPEIFAPVQPVTRSKKTILSLAKTQSLVESRQISESSDSADIEMTIVELADDDLSDLQSDLDLEIIPETSEKSTQITIDNENTDTVSQTVPQELKAGNDDIEMVVLRDDIEEIPKIQPVTAPAAEIKVVEPREVKIPASFTLKPIDLNEAEQIAREEIVIISEEDLIEELDSMDLLPVQEYESEKKVTHADRAISVEYMTPAESAIDDSHRKKIEEEVVSNATLVVEEDIRDIRKKLETTVKSSSSEEEEIVDITDRVIIIDDAGDMDRFVASIPESKRGDMKRLLRYLDGLFEKLPEDVVKRFADSEYFDLYVRIMNELEA